SYFLSARERSIGSLELSSRPSRTFTCTPNCFSASRLPLYAAALNDLSSRPPLSSTSPTWKAFAAAVDVNIQPKKAIITQSNAKDLIVQALVLCVFFWRLKAAEHTGKCLFPQGETAGAKITKKALVSDGWKDVAREKPRV